jgi:hypothetical protein
MAIAADVLTLTRGLGIPFSWLIMRLMGILSFTWLWGFLIFGIITDIFDGKLARKANQPIWIGRYEIIFDAGMFIGASTYLSSLPFLHWSFRGLTALAGVILLAISIDDGIKTRPKGPSPKNLICKAEPVVAGTLTASLFGYLLSVKIIPFWTFPAGLTRPETIITIIGFAVGALNIKSSGFRALRSVTGKPIYSVKDLRLLFKKS